MENERKFTDDELLTLWGKTKDGQPNSTEYHPLLFHLLDVANAARILWKLLAPGLRRRIADALGVSAADAEKIVVLLAGIHDLGKASAFQAKAMHFWPKVQEIGLTFGTPDDKPHAFVTADVLPNLLKPSAGGVCGWTAPHSMAYVLSVITGAHHGRFPSGILNYSAQTTGDNNWDKARRQLAALLFETLYPGAAKIAVPKDTLTDAGVGAILTGFISVADWIGSAKQFFEAKGPRPGENYAATSQVKAVEAMKAFGWREFKRGDSLPFEKIVWGMKKGKDETPEPISFKPRRMQKVVADFADAATGPYLLIAEAAMGDGKTEAALYAADRALTAGQTHGFYVALPTQATGNAMFDRVDSFLHHRNHGAALNLQLVHGGAEFNETFEKLRQAANIVGKDAADAEEAPVVAERWFTSKKQALLAPFGVGTIDQTLMGVLQTKHWFVRLFGLAGKTVVFDEVHAYDVYMGELLETLIRWLAELDCTVILLSATLPATRRQKLMDAYRAGANDEITETPRYPRVTYVPRDGKAQSVNVTETGEGARQPLTVTLERAAPDYDALAERIEKDLPNSGCAAIICNTVKQSQIAYDAVHSRLAAQGWEIILFHARTPLAWRKTKEEKVLRYFGKPDREGVTRPEKAVLIGTQVLEQSLDYDVDWMASEIAPVDLLLQRMGRLWRHERGDERPVKTARFVVLCDEPDANGDAPPAFPPGSCGKFGVYDEYTMLRSVLALRGKTTITLPDNIEPLVTAAYDANLSADLPAAWTERLETAQQEQESERADDANKARGNSISPPLGDDGEFLDVIPNQDRKLIDDDDPGIHETVRATTRLGDPSITLICLRQQADGTLTPYCGGGKVKLDKSSSHERVRELLQSAVALSRPKGLYFALVDAKVPEGWEKDAHLKYARHAVFENGRTTIKSRKGDFVIRLDEERGLTVEKEENG